MSAEPWARIERVPPAQALARWIERRGEYNATGLWPIVVLDAGELARFEIRWEETRADFKEIDVGIEGLEPRSASDREVVPVEPPGLDVPGAEALVARSFQRTGAAWMVSLPCHEPIEVPARLLEGGDLCPPPDEHETTLRRWAARHGAEPLLVGWDTLVLLVRPVQTLEEAERVAREQVDYYREGEMKEIVPHLVGLPVWDFWWD